MDPLPCGCAMIASRSLQDLEPTIFPALGGGENSQCGVMRYTSRFGRVVHENLPEKCHVLRAAWGVLLACFTGLEKVCFAFEHSGTTSSGHADGSTTIAQLSVPADHKVQSLLTGSLSALLSVPHSNAKTLVNTVLCICSFAHQPSDDDDWAETKRHDSVSWCKVRMFVDPDTLDMVISWHPGFMTQEQAENISDTYHKIISEIFIHPEALISNLNYFGDKNQRQVIAWNSDAPSNVQKCIHQAVSEQRALRPYAEAVCAWDGSFSYEQLISLSDCLASRLQISGVGPEIFVPICFDKSKWTVVAMLAVLKAGGIFVPLDPTHPLSRLRALTSKVHATTILCSPQHQDMLQSVATELIAVDGRLFANLPKHHEVINSVSSKNGAYMIFTSGTTGEPKGALIEHGSLLSSALAHGPAMMMDHNTRSLHFAASTFDVSITEILTCLILGGCVCIPSEDARLNAIEDAITQLQANWALLTPTFVKFINPDNVPCLKTLVTGGEAMTEAVIHSWSHINLINCYGPAETSVVSHVHRGMRKGKNPLNIGHQVGVHCWVVDRYNHDRLLPVGAVGELVIEGHTLAREYYQEPEKTSEAFIVDPLWTRNQPPRNGPRRMYKTGDLVRYNHDGTFHIRGRKDSQIKFHGQRIELGEIEHHVNASSDIKHGMVVLPKEGFCKGRLLAMVQLANDMNQDLVPKGQPYRLIGGHLENTAREKVARVKQLLTERLPPYMVPSMWLAVEFIPRLQSGKLDRKQTAKWVDDMSEDLYRQLNPVTVTGPSEDLVFSSETEKDLHKIWTHVLNLKAEQLGLRQSFLSVGGDSISAMQVMSECRKRGLGLSVSQIIGCRSIKALALQVKDIGRQSFHQEVLEQPFGLSPIQKLYFSRPDHARGHYNQSFLLRTSQRIPESDLRRAIETVVRRRSMLRARFSQDTAGEWQQRVTNEVESSYRLRAINLDSIDEVDHALVDSQTCLEATHGPLFAADLISVKGGEELLFVVAHHLVIDLVSWRIILQELEELLLQPDAPLPDTRSILPFQIWCKMQLEHAQSQTPEQVLPIQGIPDGNVEYWGMEDVPNVYGQMAREGFDIGPSQTNLLLSKCHESLRTEIPDVLMAAMIFSFGQTFTDRSIPAVFAEGHGRESWDPSIDLSNVVGWFTTIYPVFSGSTSQTSLVETAKLVKDGRRKVLDNGRPYFASRWLTKAGEDAFSRHWPLEITFNYLGQYQQLEREGALFTPLGDIAGEVKGAADGADIGPLTPCISLFEVSAVILKGSLRFSFGFNQNMRHQPKIRQWINSCQRSLGTLIQTLSNMTPEPTLSDFPLLSLTYDHLQLLAEQKLPKAGVSSMDLVEDIYPCSPMQSGLLISTTKNSAFYAAYTLHEVKTRSGLPVDVERLASAWKQMIEYHPILRTIFVESVAQQDSLYDQVVLKEVKCPLKVSEKDTEEEALTALSSPPLHQKENSNLLHHFEICTSKSGKVFCRLDISHVIMDGTSLSILFRDFSMAYEGMLEPREGPLYRNYIEHLQRQAIQPGIDYWKSHLAGLEPCHFPVLDDGDIVELKELRHLRVTFDELADLQRLCDDRGVTIVNAIYTAWAMTLCLYTASEEVCFGYLTSARDSQIEGIQDLVGPVINMVTCRVNASSSTTLGEIMSRVQRDYLDSLEYRHISLAEVHHALHLSDAALFNTALSYRKLPYAPENPPDLLFQECRPTYDPDEYNVSINIEADDNNMAIDLMYWSDTLSDGQAANVASTFTQALSNVLHHCDQPIAEVEHLGSWHRQQLCQWNQQIPEAVESCLHDLFKQQAISRPEAPAIASWDMDFTFAELDDASTKLALHISSLGVGLEDFVLVCFDKSPFAIVAMLAIMKAGGACVPLDPAHPDAALQLRAEDTGASVALVSPAFASRMSTMVKRTVAVDAQLLQTISIMPELPLPQVTPHNACFVIYTSGSTGRPKGVVLEHRGVATNAEHSGPKLGYESDSRVLQFASLTFDNSIAEIFTTLTRGGCVCVPSDHERLNDLAGAINRYGVTLADITPTVACLLPPTEVPTLKTLALGGEAVTNTCVDIWRDFVNLTCCYGPSECSVNSTYSGDISLPGKATNIGRAIGCVAWVVDADDHNSLVPIGCVGELLIDGPIVSRGYLNLPERMAQSFVLPPTFLERFKVQGGGLDRKLYKTGDLVRYNSDGTLTYLGRKDHQVKLNGQRIELGEIEHHIQKHLPDGWISAVELVISEGKKSLACFVCSHADASLADSSNEIMILGMNKEYRARFKEMEVLLSTLIPTYMVPSVWLPINKMPLTPSGKLNRGNLRLLAKMVPAPRMASYKLALKSGRVPSSEEEKQMAAMWASVLGIDAGSIGVEDHFFRLGGDSIGAMRLVTLARQNDINLTVASIFEKPSLLDMVHSAHPLTKEIATTLQPFSLLSNVASVDVLQREVAALARIDAEVIQDMYPCTPTQEGLVALSMKEPGAYVAQLVYRLPDGIDVIRFKRACELVVQAEPTLRTRIVHTEDIGFVQVVVAVDAPQWSTVASLDEAEQFRLQLPLHNGGRLTNYSLVDTGSAGVLFVWDIHHALYDGWCLPLMLEKIKRCYEDVPSPAALSGPSYSKFIQYLRGLDPDQSHEFWKSYLSNISTQHFPRLPSPGYQSSASGLLIHKAELSRRQVGSEITTATRIRAAWALTVSTYSATNDVVFWETLTGRDAPVDGIEDMVGATLATVPTRMVMDSSHTVAALLRYVQDKSAAVRRHQYTGIQQIKRINADTALACGAQNLIAINHGPRELADAFWDEKTNEMAGTNFYSYPLMLSCHIGDSELETVVHFDHNVIPESHMRRVMDQFELMLQSVSSPELRDEKIGNLAMLTPNDIRALQELNSSAIPPVNRLVHEVILDQALTQPQDKLAVCAWDNSLTYSELDDQSTRLACVLVENGVQANSIVPICMEKSSLVVVSIMAILKSGAAFVSLDPAHPDVRISGILGDVEASVLLSSPQYAERLGHLGPKVIQVSQDLVNGIAHRQGPTVSLSVDSPAYVIFTSGTTGKPKGTIVSHSAFCTGATAHGRALGMTESSRVLQFASYTFDASIMEILTTLIHGGVVCVPSDEERINDIASAINRMQVNWTLLTPSVAQLISPSLTPGLKTLVLGGEAMSSAHISTWAPSVHLMNAYGPSETAVIATVNSNVTLKSGPSDIGRAVGGICWVVDANNHNRLMPIGAVGELVVEGPTLAQGYLKNAHKTAESFITNPKWCSEFPGTAGASERRMYKTGDLVKISEDGTILFQNRKDDQVKVNGQRLELAEVEHHLGGDPLIQHCLAAVPSSGAFKGRLVAVLCLQSQATTKNTTQDEEMQVLGEYSFSEIKSIRENLAGHLPAYMIPTAWIVVGRIHLLPSGKLDRRRVTNCVERMTAEHYQLVLNAQEKTTALDREASEVELKLQSAWAKVLNVKVDSVPFNQSFLHLGGDSISAMQLMAVCRSSNMGVSVGQIMKSKSIIELASCVAAVEQVVHEQEQENVPFDLSPIQKVYFECFGTDSTHFNQSLLLETTRTITSRELSSALETIIRTHSMLRARYSQANGNWYQRITSEVTGSYTLHTHNKVDQSHLVASVEESQKSLNIIEGPLLAADIFEMSSTGHQIVSIVAHHLVVDVVSWNIILQDLNGLLSSATYRPAKPLSFQAWLSVQHEEVRKTALERVFHGIPAPPQDLSYWGMQGVPNVHGDSLSETIELTTDDSLLLLGPCHDAFNTEVVDVLLASLLVSFRQTFSDRPAVPSIFNEGHGREPWEHELDLSRTVGWFTTLSPVCLPESLPSKLDILDAVLWVRDFRQKLPGKGRPYFAHQMLSDDSQMTPREWPVEVAFNFLGHTDLIKSEDSVFTAVSGSISDSVSSETDIGANVPRLALVEISAAFSGQRLSLSFSFNRHMSRQSYIPKWTAACKASIQQAIQTLSEIRHERPTADLSLLPLAFGTEYRVRDKLTEIGVSHLEEIEAAYPCSPVQQGILLAQIRDPECYSYSITFSMKSKQPGDAVDAQRLADAWQRVVQRHSTLRTVFVDSLLQEGVMDQVVLREHLADIAFHGYSDSEPAQVLGPHSPLGLPTNRPPHRLNIFKDSEGMVSCVLEMSHALADGSSMPILFHDLALAYEGALVTTGLSVYRDYVAYLQQSQGFQDVDYWKEYLAGAEPCYLPSRTGGAQVPKTLRALNWRISHVAELQRFCIERDFTLSNVLQLAWALVLQAYTGLDDVLFGYLVAGRDVPVSDIDQAVGVFINMLVCRVRLSSSISLGDVLNSVQEDLAEAMNYKHVSLADLQHSMGAGNEPLFNTAYSFQRRSVSKSMATEAVSFDISDAHDPSEYDLTVNVEVWDTSVELQLCYWTDKIPDSQASNIASTLDQILTSIVTCDLAAPTGELHMLSAHCSRQLLSWNNEEPEYLEECVHHVFEQNVRQQPDETPAVEAWDGKFTYMELDAAASQLAQHLVSLGVRPDTYVPLCFQKSAWTVVAMLAVLKAGGAFVPVDPTYPPERVHFIVHNVDAKIILCSPSLANKFDALDIPTFSVAPETVSQLPQVQAVSLGAQVRPNNAAYIIFTSGTTGLPKGTIIEHGPFTTGATAHAKAIKMTSASRVLQFASYTFDASVMEILSTLLVGGCICIPSDQERMNDLAAVVTKLNANWTLLTPAVASVLKPDSMPTLKVLVTGGEAMSTDHIAKWASHAALINAYGPSEACVIAATSTKVDHHGAVLNSDPATIGRAVGCRCWIVDPRNHNRLMPIGSIGELLIEGPIVARGYLGNEAKTREAFIEHPSWRTSMDLAGGRIDRMYKTGDLVAYNPDGSLSYIARLDTQVKLNGQRIEVGEIEHHVRANLPADVQSAVDLVVPQSKTSTKALAVFFTIIESAGDPASGETDAILLPPSSGSAKLGQSLKTALRGALPSHMVPTIYIPVNRMPWTLAGKLDRKRLKAIAQSIAPQHMASYKLAGVSTSRAVTTSMQRRMQKIWAKVLHIKPESISRDDSFFRLGGDSIGAMKLVSAARTEDVVITAKNVFENPVLSDMAASCRLSNGASATNVERLCLLRDVASPSLLLGELAERCGIQRGQIQDVYPCSSLQEGLMAASMQSPGAYVARNVFELASSVDIDRLKLAWQKTVDQVDILRSRVVNSQSLKSYLVVLESHRIEWEIYTSLESAVENIRTVPEHNGGILARYAIVNPAGSGPSHLVWTIHHALYDAWSMPPVLNMVSKFYHGDGCAELRPAVSFANFAKYLAEIDRQACDQFWKNRFQGTSPATHFPTMSSTLGAESSRVSLKHTIQYEKDNLGVDVTNSSVVRAAWALVLASQAGSDDIVFGETLSGRDIDLDYVEDIIGPTLTTVPSRIQIDRDATVGQFLRAIHDQATAVIPYQHAGLQHIKRLGNAIAVACDFRNLLVIQSSDDTTSPEDILKPLEDGADQSNFFTYPLVVECFIEAHDLVLVVHHDESVIQSWQVQRIALQFQNLVEQLIRLSRDPTSKVSDLQLYGQEDVDMIRGWNHSAFRPVQESIASLFWRSATTQPDAPAIRAWDGHLTYDAVAQYAGRLAKLLVQKGVRAEALVPCCMDKSLWTTVSMLAVILAGGAIVPMDPAQPPARHAEIIRNCGALVALCSPQYQDRFSGLVESVVLVNAELFEAHLFTHSIGPQDLPTVASQDAAFVIYTSGSTGSPKGVVIDHGSFSASSEGFMRRLNITSASSIFHFTSYAFDIAMAETFIALASGACLCVPSEDMRVADLAGAMNTLGATWAFLTPSVANIQDPSRFTTLRTLVCGGEALTPETISTWGDRLELMNGYGPAECTFLAVANTELSVTKEHTNIGRALDGCRTWVVDPKDHNCLLPVGCTGELLISGPIVSRGYLNDGAKTAQSFIENPAWMHHFVSGEHHQQNFRLYKTGDLVKYNHNGTLEYKGRKDHQVKLNGQRMELGEIEARLESDQRISQAVVTLPKSGVFMGRLVATVSLGNALPQTSSLAYQELVPVSASEAQVARAQVSAFQNYLSETLPRYMVPSAWFVVESIPLLLSGKVDRTSVQSWLANMDTETSNLVINSESGEDVAVSDLTSIGQQLRRIWASVLNIAEEKMPTNRSLITLGGDSISAIQILTRCRDQSIRLSMQEVMSDRSINDLARLIEEEDRLMRNDGPEIEEQTDVEFELSPIQHLFFNNSSNSDYGDRFNQSQLLSIKGQFDVSGFKHAVNALVTRHPMLRARFKKSPDGRWTQKIVSEIETSYAFNFHNSVETSDMIPLLNASQKSVHISGPVFVVDLFQRPDGSQAVSLIAHHLVVDIVSWFNIVRDLEIFLSATSPTYSKPFSFRDWNTAQIEHAKSLERHGDNLLSFPVKAADFDFWGMSSTDNVYGDVIKKGFTVSDSDIVALMLGNANTALRTEPLDLLISAILKSFGNIFREREFPTLFNEGHGREPWDDTIDLSQTVGWFTSLCPVHVSRRDLDPNGVIDCVRKVKDMRRSVPSNGRPYFAYRYLTESGRHQFGNHEPMEILLNFLGRTQQTSKGDALLSSLDLPLTETDMAAISDVAPETRRLALFEVSISILDEGVEFIFMYNKHMLHQERIAEWVFNCQEVLVDTAKRLSEALPTPTLSDFPLIPVGYTELQELVTRSLPAARVQFDKVEDIYPCSPMQVGILLSQLLDPSQYLFHTIIEVTSANSSTIDAVRLSQACYQVICRHPALRTIFIESTYRGGVFDQVVLKPQEARITVIECREIDVMAKLNAISLHETNRRHNGPALPYQITICQTPKGRVFMKLELNHAVTDGASTSIILRDVSNAYINSLPETKAPSYKEYIKYISSQPTASSLGFWSQYLNGARYTEFPTINPDIMAHRSLGSVEVRFDRFSELQSMARGIGVTMSNMIVVAWALVLRGYTKSDDVSFGYLASGRDALIGGVDEIVGPLINMLVLRFRFAADVPLKRLFVNAQQDYLSSLPHQHVSLARVSHELGQKRGFFNTAVSIQNSSSSGGSDLHALTYESVEAFDPSEYAVTLNANTARGDEGVVFRYWTDVLSDSQAHDLALNMSALLGDFVDHSEDAVSHLRLSRDPQLLTNGDTDTDELGIWSLQSVDPKCAAVVRSLTSSDSWTDLGGSVSSPPTASRPCTPRKNNLHHKLSALWRDTLNLESASLSYEDSFFELGGDSIIAMSMVGNAREMGIQLTVADIFHNPRFGSMLDCLIDQSPKESITGSGVDKSSSLDSKKKGAVIAEQVYRPFSMLGQENAEQFVREHVCSLVGVSRASIVDVLPTTDFQTQAVGGNLLPSRWMLNYFHLDSAGHLDTNLLRESITNVVACHDILRTVFIPHQERYFQVILRQVETPLTVHDVDDIEQFTSELWSTHQHESQRPEQSSLRFIVARQKSSLLHRIFIRISHAQYDGVCFPAILGALKACYEGEPILPTPSYATYIRGALGKITPDHYAYWTALLKDSTPTNIIPRERGSLHTSPTRVLKAVVPTPSLASVNITTATVVKAAWSVVLARATGRTDVVFGHLISGRNVAGVAGIESVVGPCLNLVPVRVRYGPSWTVLRLLQHIQNQQVDNMAYESLGFKEIIDRCTDWNDDGVNGFSTVVQHQSMPQTDALTIGGNTYQVGAMASQEDTADFSVVTTPRDANSTEVCLLYAGDGAIDAGSAQDMFDSLCATITEFSENLNGFVGVY